ncbi:hypothetical protein B0H12DRAFT_1077432 [Mycena haematopus]|nr:hypothetical protein B0H12DRAFT_1077432 [Mycena haematopus]
MSTTTSMPARGDRNAPQFDSTKPHELRRYFTDLEFLLNRAAVTDETEKKKHATRFLSVEDQEIWEALKSFGDNTKTFAQFKADVLKLYAGNDEDRRFELSDLDSLVGQYSRVGILTLDDLKTFYRQFLRITTYLWRRSAFPTAVTYCRDPASFEDQEPEPSPCRPRPVADLYEAAEYALAGASGAFVPDTHHSPSPTTSSEMKPDPGIAALLGTMTKLIEVLATQKAVDGASPKRTRPDGCGYCSETDHFIGDCLQVLEDIKEGLVRRNSDGRVVLPSGAFVPKVITGKNLRARVKKWHEQNPGQVAAAQLLVDVAVEHLSSSSSSPAARTFALTDDQRMQMLLHEMNALRTRSQAKRALANNEQVEPDRTIPPTASAAPASTPVTVPPSDPTTTAAPTTASTPAAAAVAPTPPPADKIPQHPFSNARDAAYAPPTDRNAGLPPAAQNKSGPAYRTAPPIYNPRDAAAVSNPRQIWSIAPEVRSQLREATTPRRAPPKDGQTPTGPSQQLLHHVDTPLPYSDDFAHDINEVCCYDTFLNSLPTTYTNSSQADLPAGGIVVPDPYAVYYESGSVPEDLVVSMESSAIRSILPIIDNQQQIESIVDGGSQIVAMAETICHELGLSYDPRIILRMQSANGSVSPSLGLARNVPFRIADIILYLQVHIVRNPAYDVLLGRPFDVLTQSVIRNYANEDQTITICDPNSGKMATVPTIPRGPPAVARRFFTARGIDPRSRRDCTRHRSRLKYPRRLYH